MCRLQVCAGVCRWTRLGTPSGQVSLCGPGLCFLTQNAKQERAMPSTVFEATDVLLFGYVWG